MTPPSLHSSPAAASDTASRGTPQPVRASVSSIKCGARMARIQQQVPQAKETTRKAGSVLPIQPVRERIFYAWLSGTKERSLSASYRHPREVIEEVNRERARELWRERCAVFAERKAA